MWVNLQGPAHTHHGCFEHHVIVRIAESRSPQERRRTGSGDVTRGGTLRLGEEERENAACSFMNLNS
jgi:hypothetical protein